MARYMQKYVGTYRVLAEYNRATNDFPRLDDGTLDPSFDDLYIPCASKSRIYHIGGRMLEAYIPSIGRGHNIMKALYEEYVGSIDKCTDVIVSSNDTDEKTERIQYNYEKMYQELISSGLLSDIKENSEEVIFKFPAVNIDKIATIMKARTSGASISPFSTRNLPKSDYKIPDEDLDMYKQATASIPDESLTAYLNINNSFLEKIATKKFTEKDIKADMKLKCMKFKEYIHFTGRWNEYLKYIQQYVKENL